MVHFTPNNITLNKRKFKFTAKQRRLLETILAPNTRIIPISGPAGTAKTYMSTYACIQWLLEDAERSLLYVRSIAESADLKLGSLPGNIDEKFDPFLMPLEDKLLEMMQPSDIMELKAKGRIAATPINFLRGAHLTKTMVIADEAQNMSLKELVTLITRISEDTKIIICGDPMQTDINGRSGFKTLYELFDDEESKEKGIHCFKLTNRDIVRDDLLKFIIKKLESAK